MINMDIFIYLMLICLVFNKDFNKNRIDKNQLITRDLSVALKGICSFLVVMQHLESNIDRGVSLYIFEKSGKYAVAIFFFLSGYGIFKSINNNKNYMQVFFKKRIMRVYLPFVFVNIVSIIIHKSYLNYDYFQILKYISGVELIDPTLWFIQVILYNYIVLYVFMKINNNDFSKVIKYIFISILIYIIIGTLFRFSEWKINTAIVFWVGLYISSHENYIYDIIENKKSNLIIMNILLFIFFNLLSNVFNNYLIKIFIDNISIITFIIIFIIIIDKVQIGNKISMFIGKYSYEYYLLHMKLILIMNINKYIKDYQIFLYFITLFILGIIYNILNNLLYRKFFNKPSCCSNRRYLWK